MGHPVQIFWRISQKNSPLITLHLPLTCTWFYEKGFTIRNFGFFQERTLLQVIFTYASVCRQNILHILREGICQMELLCVDPLTLHTIPPPFFVVKLKLFTLVERSQKEVLPLASPINYKANFRIFTYTMPQKFNSTLPITHT